MGPFIGKQLIQHLVTANPSPQYVARVSAAFNNNGNGVRGDMKAVLRAILLDADARGPVKTDPSYGRLRAPAQFLTATVRAANGRSDGVYLVQKSAEMGQDVFGSPTVFNFYPPDFKTPGTNLLGPSFKIMQTGTILNRLNFTNQLLFGGIGADRSVPGSFGTQVDLAGLQTLAGNPDQLLDALNTVMLHGTMSADMRNAIKPAINAVGTNDPAGRVRTALYLIATDRKSVV